MLKRGKTALVDLSFTLCIKLSEKQTCSHILWILETATAEKLTKVRTGSKADADLEKAWWHVALLMPSGILLVDESPWTSLLSLFFLSRGKSAATLRLPLDKFTTMILFVTQT